MVKPVDPDRHFRYLFRIRLTQADSGLIIFIDNLTFVVGCAFKTNPTENIVITSDP